LTLLPLDMLLRALAFTLSQTELIIPKTLSRHSDTEFVTTWRIESNRCSFAIDFHICRVLMILTTSGSVSRVSMASARGDGSVKIGSLPGQSVVGQFFPARSRCIGACVKCQPILLLFWKHSSWLLYLVFVLDEALVFLAACRDAGRCYRDVRAAVLYSRGLGRLGYRGVPGQDNCPAARSRTRQRRRRRNVDLRAPGLRLTCWLTTEGDLQIGEVLAQREPALLQNQQHTRAHNVEPPCPRGSLLMSDAAATS
jgi:hypothetical protein